MSTIAVHPGEEAFLDDNNDESLYATCLSWKAEVLSIVKEQTLLLVTMSTPFPFQYEIIILKGLYLFFQNCV
jgi:predicted membrane chloride channel (bestrophin family)